MPQYIFFIFIANGRISGIHTVIPVISHDKILIFPQSYTVYGNSWIQNDLSSITLIKKSIVNIDIAFRVNSYCFARQTNNSFDKKLIIPVSVRKYNYIKSLGIAKSIGNLFDQQ